MKTSAFFGPPWALRKRLGVAGLAMLLACACAAQSPSDWPSKPVKLVVPYVPGGGADTLGRMIANHLTQVYKQPFVIDNRAGAGGVVGSQTIPKSAPDGHTLVVSGIGSHVIAPATVANTYDPLKDFSHIALLGGPPLALVVDAELPVKDLAALLAYASSKPQGLSWGSPGLGTHGHLIGELLSAGAKSNWVHVSYRGGSGAMADVIGHQLPAAIVTFSSASPHIKSGRARALAVTSGKRMVEHGDIPTFAELGYPQLTSTTWFALSGPPNMPKALMDKINAEVRKGMLQARAQGMLNAESIETANWDVDAFNVFFKSEIDRWTPLVKSLDKTKK